MQTNRYLIIKSLAFAIPDDFRPGDQVSIDEALECLLEYRKRAAAVVNNNRAGNFAFMAADFPDSTNPEMLNFTPELLLDFVQSSPEKSFAGMMATVIYDPELGALRNCYSATEMVDFERRKAFLIASAKSVEEATMRSAEAIAAQNCLDIAVAAHFTINANGEIQRTNAEETPACDDCEQICQETCPDEPAVEEKMQESEDS